MVVRGGGKDDKRLRSDLALSKLLDEIPARVCGERARTYGNGCLHSSPPLSPETKRRSKRKVALLSCSDVPKSRSSDKLGDLATDCPFCVFATLRRVMHQKRSATGGSVRADTPGDGIPPRQREPPPWSDTSCPMPFDWLHQWPLPMKPEDHPQYLSAWMDLPFSCLKDLNPDFVPFPTPICISL